MEYIYMENPDLITEVPAPIYIRDISAFPFNIISKTPSVRCKRGEKKKNNVYVDAIAAVDLESTKIPNEELSVMFIIQFGLMIGDDLYFVGCREWETFNWFMEAVASELDERKMPIFDFNLNYEFGYLRSQFTFTDVFFKDLNHPLKASSHGVFEWRDAQALFGPGGLKAATEGLPHAKLGDFDYTKKRFSWSKIIYHELEYCINDVWGLCEAVKREMNRNNVTIYGLKLTFTGWVRKDINRILYPMRHLYNSAFTEHDSFEVYEAICKAKRGGNTHGSLVYNGVINSFFAMDAASMYPNVMVHCRYPIAPFAKINMPDEATLRGEVERNENAVLTHIRIYNLELINEFEPVPYVSKDKCHKLIGLGTINRLNKNGTTIYKQNPVTGEEDNGRVRACCHCEMWVTDVDLRVLFYGPHAQYKCDYFEIDEMWTSPYGYLPKEIREYLIDLFIAKTAYKNVPGKEAEYAAAKVRINAVYGLFAQALLSDMVEYDPEDDDYYTVHIVDKPNYLLRDEYYDRCKSVLLCPRIGVWVCAHARYQLQELIDVIKNDGKGTYADVLYCDTDSVFFLNVEEHRAAIDAYNQHLINRAIDSGMYAEDKHGVTHYCGSFEDDKEGKLVYLGAKKYAYVKPNGKLILTVAGVPKEDGAKELEAEGGLEAFKPGMIFHAGKLRPIYNTKDDYGTRKLYDYNGETGTVHITSNICLVDVEYKLGLGKTYGNVVNAYKNGNLEPLRELLDNSESDALQAAYFNYKYNLE